MGEDSPGSRGLAVLTDRDYKTLAAMIDKVAADCDTPHDEKRKKVEETCDKDALEEFLAWNWGED